MIDLYPTTCNLCGGAVEYISNAEIYGQKYGSGYCYYCTSCGAYVGTHVRSPRKAMGILANKEMREWKVKCHSIFDPFWQVKKGRAEKSRRRSSLYIRLAGEMRIAVPDCHFGHFDLNHLQHAYKILQGWQKHPPEDLDYEIATPPCSECHLAEWTDMYGVMCFACDMHACIKAEEDEVWL